MDKAKKNKERYNFLIDEATYDDFSMLCEELGWIRSKVVEKALKEFIEKNKELLKKLK